MGLEFITRPEAGDYVIADTRLYRTEDDRLVPEGDPAARWLFCVPDTRISRADAERYGLLEDQSAPEAPKSRQAASNKARAKAEDK